MSEDLKDFEEPIVENARASREAEILGGYTPLRTLMHLILGPFISQLSNALYGMANTIWLAHYVNELCTTALSAAITVDYFAIAFGTYMNAAACSKLAAIFGERKEGVPKLITDLVRTSFVLGLIVPAVLLPCSSPLMYWLGCSSDVVQLGFDYLVIVIGGTFFSCVYLLLCGCLQAEGRTYVYSIAQASSIILNSFVFNPIFLIVFKMGIRGSALSTLLAQAIPGIVLFALYYAGKFTVKPKFSEFIEKPSPELWDSLKIGSSSLLSGLSASLPSLAFQKFIGITTTSTSEFDLMMSLYNSYIRIFEIVVAIYISISQALLPAISYAYSTGNRKRVVALFGHSFWMSTAVGVGFMIILFAAQVPISKIFSSNADFLSLFYQCLTPFWGATFLFSWLYISTTLLQATNRPMAAFWCALITQMLIFPLSTVVVYLIYPHNPKKLYYAGIVNDITCFVAMLPFLISPAKELLKGCRSAETAEKEPK